MGAAPVGPARLDLREDALAELVAGTREREGDVRMEALEAPTPARAADAVVERGAAVVAGRVTGELPPQPPLLVVAGGEARGERGLVRVAALQRSTPPAASSRDTAATRCRHVR